MIIECLIISMVDGMKCASVDYSLNLYIYTVLHVVLKRDTSQGMLDICLYSGVACGFGCGKFS